MPRIPVFVGVTVLCFAVIGFGQMPPSSSGSQSSSRSGASTQKEETLTGCLMAGMPSASSSSQKSPEGTEGLSTPSSRAGSAASSSDFYLKTPDGKQIALQADQADLKKNVGHQVEIKGTTSGQAGKESFQVADVKSVADSCTASRGTQPSRSY